MNLTAVFWHRKRILAALIIRAGMQDDEESLLWLFGYRMLSEEEMLTMEIWGLECHWQAEELRACREITTEPKPEVRLEWVWVINDTCCSAGTSGWRMRRTSSSSWKRRTGGL